VTGPCTDGALSGGALLSEISSVVPEPGEARRIVAQALGVPLGALVPLLDDPVAEPQSGAARAMAARRAAGQPLQHVLGSWGFRTLEVLVDRRALVPRPETEQVAGVALEALHGGAGARLAVDLGTGSGVIALSLAAEGPTGLEVWATDRSPQALELARANLELLADTDPLVTGRVRLAQGDWFEALPDCLTGAVDLVVSNPPYVSAAQWERLDPVVRHHDPYEALVPGPGGSEALTYILDEARRWLAPSGALVLELSPEQAAVLRRRAHELGYGQVEVRPDLAGRDRVLLSRWPG